MENTNLIGIASILIAALTVGLVVGYYFHRKKRKKEDSTILDDITNKYVLNSRFTVVEIFCVNDLLTWIDEITVDLRKNVGCQYEVKVLPNSSTKKLLHNDNENIYIALFCEISNTKTKILDSKTYKCTTLSDSLHKLDEDNVIVVPVDI